jgi:hypothetical protein
MYTTKNYLAVTLAIVFASSAIGCGQGFKSLSKPGDNSSQSSNAADISAQMQKAADASAQAQKAMDDANAAIAQITDDKGNINISLFKTSSTPEVSTQGLLKPLVDKLNVVFDKVFAKIDLVKTQFAAARLALADAMAKLNAADPAQAAQIQMIQTELAKIDALQATFQNTVHLLAVKLDLASFALDKLITSATSLIPIPGVGAIAGIFIDYYLMSDVKDLISTVKAKLLAV